EQVVQYIVRLFLVDELLLFAPARHYVDEAVVTPARRLWPEQDDQRFAQQDREQALRGDLRVGCVVEFERIVEQMRRTPAQRLAVEDLEAGIQRAVFVQR